MLVRSATKGKSRSATTMMLRRLTYSGPPQLGVVPEAVFVIIVLASRVGDCLRSLDLSPAFRYHLGANLLGDDQALLVDAVLGVCVVLEVLFQVFCRHNRRVRGVHLATVGVSEVRHVVVDLGVLD